MPEISRIPAEYLPPIDELPGDMHVLAAGMEERFPGMGVLIVLAMAEITGG